MGSVKRFKPAVKMLRCAKRSAAVALLASTSACFAGAQQPTAPSALPDSPGAIQPVIVAQSNAQEPVQEPVGTAVAPPITAAGVAAARPAGAVVAPAKQRRVRTFLISMGVVAGAAVAVGTVVALENASPSRPPGTH